MSNLEQRVYANYRNALKKLKAASRYSGGAGRTSERKQKALKLTADRYKIRIGEVKNIVREMDAENNVTHEHDENYQQTLKVEQAYNAHLSSPEFSDDGVCENESCEDGREVRLRPAPGVMNGEREIAFTYTCFPCYYKASMSYTA